MVRTIDKAVIPVDYNKNYRVVVGLVLTTLHHSGIESLYRSVA
jgi:hypothetical protein